MFNSAFYFCFDAHVHIFKCTLIDFLIEKNLTDF